MAPTRGAQSAQIHRTGGTACVEANAGGSLVFGVDDMAMVLDRGLAGYLRAVANAVGVPFDGVTYEISDTATAYLALASHRSDELMLTWSELTGWTVSVETDPGEAVVVLARLGEAVPEPSAVARFVNAVIAGRTVQVPPQPGAGNRSRLAARLLPYATREPAMLGVRGLGEQP